MHHDDINEEDRKNELRNLLVDAATAGILLAWIAAEPNQEDVGSCWMLQLSREAAQAVRDQDLKGGHAFYARIGLAYRTALYAASAMDHSQMEFDESGLSLDSDTMALWKRMVAAAHKDLS